MKIPDYPKYLEDVIGLRLMETYKGAKEHHSVQCTKCDHIWSATPVSKVQAFKKYGQNGCPKCDQTRRDERYAEAGRAALLKIKDLGFTVLTEYTGYKQKLTVRREVCGHIWDVSPNHLIDKNVQCRICNDAIKRERCDANSKALQDIFRASAPEWEVYKQTVYTLTINAYRKHKKVINPLDLKRGRAGTEGAYQVDHIVPVRWCFDNGVPPEVCAHHTNLQMLGWLDNVTARDYLKEDLSVPLVLKEYVDVYIQDRKSESRS